MIPAYPYQAEKPTDPDYCCLVRKMATITRRRLGVKANPMMWSSTPDALKVLEESYLRTTRETANTLGIGQLFWPDLDSLTKGSSELFMKIHILNNALRDITLFKDIALSTLHRTDKEGWFSVEGYCCKAEGIKALGLSNRQNTIGVSENTRIPQEEGPLPNLGINSDQLGGLNTVESPELSALLGNVLTGSQNCISAFASSHQFTPGRSLSGDTGESASASYNINAQFEPTSDGNISHIGDVNHGMSQLQRQPDPVPAVVKGPAWTPINGNHKQATSLKGVLCPIKNCSRNNRSPPKYFARADNLGGHLRKVHGIHIPSRARVRHWITGNKSQVLLQAAAERTRELHELGILGADGTWERPEF
ncbi:hypothetical protein EV426DRAFT_615429, partial [Tirmania nivea]